MINDSFSDGEDSGDNEDEDKGLESEEKDHSEVENEADDEDDEDDEDDVFQRTQSDNESVDQEVPTDTYSTFSQSKKY
jgi:DNA-directed RNA polymerase subunit delta